MRLLLAKEPLTLALEKQLLICNRWLLDRRAGKPSSVLLLWV